MPIAVFKSVREVSSEDAVHVAENLLKENAGKKWRTKAPGEKSAYVILEFEDPQQITGIDIGNEHAAFIEVLVSRTGCQADDFKELLLSSSFMTPIESKNSSNQNRVRCFSGPALVESVLPEKWKLLKIVCTQPFNRHVQFGLSFVKVHVVGAPPAPAKVKSLLPQGMMQFGAFKLREESPDSETDNQVNRFQRWKKETHQQTPAVSTAAAIRDAGSSASALRRLSVGKVSGLAASPLQSPKPSPSPSPIPNSLRSESPPPSDAKPLDRNRSSLLFGEDDDDEAADEGNAKKQRLSKHLEADKDRRRLEQEKEKERKKNKSSRHSLDKSTSKEDTSFSKEEKSSKEHRSSSKEDKSKIKEEKSSPRESKSAKKEERSHSKENKSGRKEAERRESKHKNVSGAKESPRQSTQKRHSSPTAGDSTRAKKQKVADKPIQYRPFNQLLKGVVLVISGIQNPDRADLRSKATALGAKYKADWETGCTHLICAFKNTPKYNQVKGKGKIVTRSWIEKCYDLKRYLPWRRYAIDTKDLGEPESDEEVCDEANKPSSRRESSETDVEMLQDIQVKSTNNADIKVEKNVDINQNASSGIDTEDELERVTQETKKKTKLKTPVKSESRDEFDASTDEEDYLVLKKKQ